MPEKWKSRFRRLRQLGIVALVGLGLLLVSLVAAGVTHTFCIVAGLLLALPAFIYFYVLVILHWKDRYRGRHSDMWGILILIETSGWMKLVYLFRHMIPDMRHDGRYRVDIISGGEDVPKFQSPTAANSSTSAP